jgi:DNA-binding response OmpR family regulator
VLRRTAASAPPADLLKRGSLIIDFVRYEVTCEDKPISLTATEFRLLQFLAAHPGRVFSRGEIIDGVLGKELSVLDRTVDVHVMSLRRKLGPCGDSIETVRGFGYRFCTANGD